ncbi:hypothetical protein ABZS79_29550 [Streptomyces griseoloalbus]|uniref:hypothetical protein n=1 Tax=Streptomyces griseoloalbus TaxID=67303 RepID=UPI0033AB75A0
MRCGGWAGAGEVLAELGAQVPCRAGRHVLLVQFPQFVSGEVVDPRARPPELGRFLVTQLLVVLVELGLGGEPGAGGFILPAPLIGAFGVLARVHRRRPRSGQDPAAGAGQHTGGVVADSAGGREGGSHCSVAGQSPPGQGVVP